MESLNHFIKRDLSIKASQLANLTKILRACLPGNCQQHVTVAGIRDQQLILITDSPVWVSRLRMHTQNILEMLEKNSNLRITQLRIKQSQPVRLTRPEPPRKYRSLSKSNADIIAQTAESISDPELQQALLKLSRNSRNKN